MNLPVATRDMLGRKDVVSYAEALRIIDRHLPPLDQHAESIPLDHGLGRITMAGILSPEDLPPHPRSTMDGYAVCARDTFGASPGLPGYLEVTGEVHMGESPLEGPEPGCCFKIATGGLLPSGTDAVVMLEHTVKVDDTMVEVVQPVAQGSNVIGRGDDVRRGEPLLPAGHCLRPQDLGLLAGLGITEIQVRPKVRVGILSTGDELVPYTESPPPGKIRDMNGITLCALVRELGGVPRSYGIAPDDEAHFYRLAGKALAENELILFSGSSSVGARDLGERVLDSLEPPGIILHGIAIKPGKPVIFAMAGRKPLFGLPGHPVSAAVAFDLFVRPVMRHLSGKIDDGLPQRRVVKARFMRNLNSAAGRRDFVRIRLENLPGSGEFEAYPVLGKSGALSTMVKAQGYMVIREEQQGIEQGEMVEVHLFD